MNHNATTNTCETCKWWACGPDGLTGQCHRYPPTLPQRNGPTDLADFPGTAFSEWCGEYAKDEASDAP